MIIDSHMHIWDRIHGLVKGELPVRPLGSGMISIGEEKMLGMPATLNECQALAEYVIGEFDASGVEEVLTNQRGNLIRMIREAANENGERFLETVDTQTYGSNT